MRQNQIRQIAEQLAQAGLTSFDVIEKVVEEYKISAVSLFLEVNDAYLRCRRPDVWMDIASDDLEEENI